MHITTAQLEQFLHKKYRFFEDIDHIGDGWHSQAFSFVSGEDKMVVRLSRHLRDSGKMPMPPPGSGYPACTFPPSGT